MPRLVIDGADILDPTVAFVSLVDQAKSLSNSDLLKVIFVSSEGIVIPLLEFTSSKTRAATTVEIVDIMDKDAVLLLSKVMPLKLAQDLMAVIGGRLCHLLLAISIYEETCNEEAFQDIT